MAPSRKWSSSTLFPGIFFSVCLVHAAGHDSVVFESINLVTKQVTGFPIFSPGLQHAPLAISFWPSQQNYLWSRSNDPHSSPSTLYRMLPGGSSALIGDMDHKAKGLAVMDTVPVAVPALDGGAYVLGALLLASGLWLRCRVAS